MPRRHRYDPRTEAWLDDLVTKAPPLNSQQRALVERTFNAVLAERDGGRP